MVQSSIDLEETMVDVAINSVINHEQDFSEVFEMQKDQSNEIQKQQALLKTLEVKNNKKAVTIDIMISCNNQRIQCKNKL